MADLSLFGQILAKMCQEREQRVGESYTTSRLAREAGIANGHLWRACHGFCISEELVNKLCIALECDDLWCEALLNAAGHASPRQQQQAARLLGEG